MKQPELGWRTAWMTLERLYRGDLAPTSPVVLGLISEFRSLEVTALSDSERIDWLERQLGRPDVERTAIMLTGWWSNPEGPDGYAVAVDYDGIPNPEEWPTLRTAIDAAARTESLQSSSSAE
jgi:hypothetical protein